MECGKPPAPAPATLAASRPRVRPASEIRAHGGRVFSFVSRLSVLYIVCTSHKAYFVVCGPGGARRWGGRTTLKYFVVRCMDCAKTINTQYTRAPPVARQAPPDRTHNTPSTHINPAAAEQHTVTPKPRRVAHSHRSARMTGGVHGPGARPHPKTAPLPSANRPNDTCTCTPGTPSHHHHAP